MDFFTAPFILGLLQIFLDALLWGTFGYVVFKICKGKEKDWWIGAMATFVVYEFINLDPFTIVPDFLLIFVGFKIGQNLVGGLLSKSESS